MYPIMTCICKVLYVTSGKKAVNSDPIKLLWLTFFDERYRVHVWLQRTTKLGISLFPKDTNTLHIYQRRHNGALFRYNKYMYITKHSECAYRYYLTMRLSISSQIHLFDLYNIECIPTSWDQRKKAMLSE